MVSNQNYKPNVIHIACDKFDYQVVAFFAQHMTRIKYRSLKSKHIFVLNQIWIFKFWTYDVVKVLQRLFTIGPFNYKLASSLSNTAYNFAFYSMAFTYSISQSLLTIV